MVCMDGFILTHAYEPIDIPEQAQVDEFLPPFEPVQVLDPSQPYSIGAMVGPEAFTEVRYLAHQKQLEALSIIPEIAEEFGALFGRKAGGLLQCYRIEGAETVVVALGSVSGSIKEVVDDMRDGGVPIGAVNITSFRPFPLEAVRSALSSSRRVVCLEKSLSPGLGGVLASNVRMSLRGVGLPVYTVIAGLGGRPVTRASLTDVFTRAVGDELDDVTFLDLNWRAINEQLSRARYTRHSGPIAENILRALNPGGVPETSRR
jgi:pyruvate ferredoxin oxidoreductase alpha subunit